MELSLRRALDTKVDWQTAMLNGSERSAAYLAAIHKATTDLLNIGSKVEHVDVPCALLEFPKPLRMYPMS